AAPTLSLVYLRQEQQRTEEALQAESRRRQQARLSMDMLFGPGSKDWIGKQLAVSQEPKKVLEQALAIYTALAGETSTDAASQAGLARAHHQVGEIQKLLGRSTEAEAAYERSAALFTQLLVDAPGRLEYRRELAIVLMRRYMVWNLTGRGEQAEA